MLGSYIARLFPFLISILIFSKEELNLKINSSFFILIFLSATLITILSGERTALVLMILNIILIFFTCGKIRKLVFYILMMVTICLTTIILTK